MLFGEGDDCKYIICKFVANPVDCMVCLEEILIRSRKMWLTSLSVDILMNQLHDHEVWTYMAVLSPPFQQADLVDVEAYKLWLDCYSRISHPDSQEMIGNMHLYFKPNEVSWAK